LPRLADDSPERHVPWLPGERFELALDSRHGAITSSAVGADVLTITTCRAVRFGSGRSVRVTEMLSLDRIVEVQIEEVSVPIDNLKNGLIALAIGVALGWVAFQIFDTPFLTLLIGGISILFAVFMIASYLFPDEEGALLLHAPGRALKQPLLTDQARRDAHLVAHCVFRADGGIQSTLAAPNCPTANARMPGWGSARGMVRSGAAKSVGPR
jgi:hypothetical protein